MLFFFNDTATTEIYTLSLHDALPISIFGQSCAAPSPPSDPKRLFWLRPKSGPIRIIALGLMVARSEEHTSELQSRPHLVCRLLLEKKKTKAPISFQLHCAISKIRGLF